MTDEESFLTAIEADPDNQVVRGMYADWLDEQDRPGGVYLRAELAWYAEYLSPRLNKPGRNAPLPTELIAASEGLPESWILRVTRSPVDFCPKQGYQTRCGQAWPRDRVCQECGRNIHLALRVDDALLHLRMGRVVALAPWLTPKRKELSRIVPIRLDVPGFAPEGSAVSPSTLADWLDERRPPTDPRHGPLGS